MAILDHRMPSTTGPITNLAEKPLTGADRRTTMIRGQRREGRFDLHRPLGTLDFDSQHVEQLHVASDPGSVRSRGEFRFASAHGEDTTAAVHFEFSRCRRGSSGFGHAIAQPPADPAVMAASAHRAGFASFFQARR